MALRLRSIKGHPAPQPPTTSISLGLLVKKTVGRAWKGLPLYESLAAMTNSPIEDDVSLINVTQKSREGAREVQVAVTYCTGV